MPSVELGGKAPLVIARCHCYPPILAPLAVALGAQPPILPLPGAVGWLARRLGAAAGAAGREGWNGAVFMKRSLLGWNAEGYRAVALWPALNNSTPQCGLQPGLRGDAIRA